MARLTMMPGDPCNDPPRPEPHRSALEAPQTSSSDHRTRNNKAGPQSLSVDDNSPAHSQDIAPASPPGHSLATDDDDDIGNVTKTNPTRESNLTETVTYIAHTDEDLIAALQLVSDTVAQQRQLAAKALLSLPLYWAVVALPLPYFYVEWYHDSSDWALFLVLWAGIFLATLTVIQFLVRGYLDAAERVGRWSWLYGDQWIRNRFGRTVKRDGSSSTAGPKRHSTGWVDTDPDFKTDYVFATKMGERVVAVLVLRITNTWALNPRKSLVFNGKGDRLQKKAFVRAWAVQRQLRGNGIGIALLRFVVRWCLDNAIDGPEFADDHAHSLRLLPLWITSEMEKNDTRARTKLYWEIQHYSTPWWKEQRGSLPMQGQNSQQSQDVGTQQDHVSSSQCTKSSAAEGLLGSTFQGIFSPRRKVEMSRATTKKILSGS